LVQRVRDEAHRFAITFHRVVRKKDAFASALDGISGLGPARRRALLRQFGSVENIRGATLEALTEVRGITRPVAAAIKEML
jgi:excinuclease ABC subunit C